MPTHILFFFVSLIITMAEWGVVAQIVMDTRWISISDDKDDEVFQTCFKHYVVPYLARVKPKSHKKYVYILTVTDCREVPDHMPPLREHDSVCQLFYMPWKKAKEFFNKITLCDETRDLYLKMAMDAYAIGNKKKQRNVIMIHGHTVQTVQLPN